MPPLKGIDRGINGDMLKALEEIGHGAQIAIVDASYDIPIGAQVVNYQGDSSATALRGILDLVPVDEPANDIGKVKSKVVAMLPDPPNKEIDSEAFMAFAEVLPTGTMPILAGTTRFGGEESAGDANKGFYAAANDPEKHTLFVRTRDEKAYACAMFVVGHSQS